MKGAFLNTMKIYLFCVICYFLNLMMTDHNLLGSLSLGIKLNNFFLPLF